MGACEQRSLCRHRRCPGALAATREHHRHLRGAFGDVPRHRSRAPQRGARGSSREALPPAPRAQLGAVLGGLAHCIGHQAGDLPPGSSLWSGHLALVPLLASRACHRVGLDTPTRCDDGRSFDVRPWWRQRSRNTAGECGSPRRAEVAPGHRVHGDVARRRGESRGTGCVRTARCSEVVVALGVAREGCYGDVVGRGAHRRGHRAAACAG
mmetsp:Transcript_129584/g.415485  ORF Transcript_129584/g.415485 Transcript_129584/m.415485 type:complete len:210 (+) Transcript_129584:2725-3354(+)